MSDATATLSKADVDSALGKALKACFVISPMGANIGETRRRGDYVLKNFIKPACLLAGYDAKRSDELKPTDVTLAIRDSLFGSPMAVAYLGARFSCGIQLMDARSFRPGTTASWWR